VLRVPRAATGGTAATGGMVDRGMKMWASAT
jgi:hypothetical protein